MLSFKEYLLLEDDDFPANQKYLYGINHTDNDAGREIKKLAETLMYDVDKNGGHYVVREPGGGSLVTVISMGTGGLKRHRDALKQIHDHQMNIGGFSGFEHDVKSIRKELRVRELNDDDKNQQKKSSNLR